MKKCKTYDCQNNTGMQKKVGDEQNVYDEKRTDKLVSKSSEQRECNATIESRKSWKVNGQ